MVWKLINKIKEKINTSMVLSLKTKTELKSTVVKSNIFLKDFKNVFLLKSLSILQENIVQAFGIFKQKKWSVSGGHAPNVKTTSSDGG